MKMSEQINELASALCAMQSELTAAVKDKTNPFFKSKYADLDSCWNAIRIPLTKNNLSIVQIPSFQDNRMTLKTILMHKSGQFIEGEILFNLEKTDPQSLGSAISYFRRYCLSAIVGLTQDDDDAQSVSLRTPPKPSASQMPPKAATISHGGAPYVGKSAANSNYQIPQKPPQGSGSLGY